MAKYAYLVNAVIFLIGTFVYAIRFFNNKSDRHFIDYLCISVYFVVTIINVVLFILA